jgi:hypothetical protein
VHNDYDLKGIFMCKPAVILLTAISLGAFCQTASAACPVDKPDCPPTKDGGESPFPKPLGPIYPHYYLITILYPPPGTDSEVKYGAGSTTGSRCESTSSFKTGFKVSVETTFVNASSSWEGGSKDGTSLEVKKETTNTQNMKNIADSIDHGKDTFLLWMNPQADVTQTGDKSFSLSWHTSDGKPIAPVPVTVEELQGRAPLPEWKQKLLASLTANDRQKILSMDFFFVSPPAPAGNRPLPPAPRFVLDWDHENTTEMQSGTIQKSEVNLRTTTIGYHDVINVYVDTLFGSFAFVSVGRFPPGTEVLSGTVTDPQGHPVSNQRVLVRMPDGITRTVFTNARGIYRVFGGPVGVARVQIAGQERTVPIEAGKVHDGSIHLGNSIPSHPPRE